MIGLFFPFLSFISTGRSHITASGSYIILGCTPLWPRDTPSVTCTQRCLLSCRPTQHPSSAPARGTVHTTAACWGQQVSLGAEKPCGPGIGASSCGISSDCVASPVWMWSAVRPLSPRAGHSAGTCLRLRGRWLSPSCHHLQSPPLTGSLSQAWLPTSSSLCMMSGGVSLEWHWSPWGALCQPLALV